MNNSHQIIKLYKANKETKQMDPMESLELQLGGVIGDKYFGREDREVLISSITGYQLALEHGISMKYGTLGENILTNIQLSNLSIGDKLQIRDVTLEISMLCPVCTHLATIEKKLPKLIKNDRGIFAKVIQGGEITMNDTIKLL